MERQRSYRRERLAGAPAALELPTDHPRPATPNHRGGIYPIRFGPGLSAKLTALSRRQGATLYMTLLAAFQALLARSAGRGGGLADRGPCPSADRRSPRALRQQPGAAGVGLRAPEFPVAAVAGPRACAGSLCASGPAVRKAGGRTDPGPGHVAPADLQGSLRAAE